MKRSLPRPRCPPLLARVRLCRSASSPSPATLATPCPRSPHRPPAQHSLTGEDHISVFYRDANEPTRSQLRDCENFTDGSFAALVSDNILCICHRCTNTVAVHPSMISFCTQSQPHPVSSQSQYWRAHIWFILPHCPVSTQCHTVPAHCAPDCQVQCTS